MSRFPRVFPPKKYRMRQVPSKFVKRVGELVPLRRIPSRRIKRRKVRQRQKTGLLNVLQVVFVVATLSAVAYAFLYENVSLMWYVYAASVGILLYAVRHFFKPGGRSTKR